MKHRKVEYFEYVRKEGFPHLQKTKIGDAIFHDFGVDYEEFESGPGNYSTAIIELENGEIKNIPVKLVRFMDAPE